MEGPESDDKPQFLKETVQESFNNYQVNGASTLSDLMYAIPTPGAIS